MTKNRVALYALGNSLVASCYMALIAAIMSGAETFFGRTNSILAMSGFFLLFASSAAILGVVVFGRSVVWYLEGKRADAVTLAIYTVCFLLIITLAVLLALAV
ncbi:MAG: hypothetical protein V1885_02210 [Candidatus Brennerbacteria bacterium]